MKRPRSAVLVGFLAAIGSAQASGIAEIEVNHPINIAQPVPVSAGSVAIAAVLGNVTGSVVNDLDFFTFYGQEGDVVTLDIDGGVGGAKSVDTVIAVFATTAGYPILRYNDDRPVSNDTAPNVDEGSANLLDARIDNFRLPATGFYVVGVSNTKRWFMNGGTVSNPSNIQNGDYSLIISGVSSAVLQINIEVKPGSGELAPINPKSKGKVPVALLSSGEFNALNVDTASLTFGPTGDERSLSHCGRGEDVNGDGRLDLVCHFQNQVAGFKPGDLEGIVRGKTLPQGSAASGQAFEGRGYLKVIPQKRMY